MENDFGDRSGVTETANTKPGHTVTTLYYTCDSGVFKSSESSVQVVSASTNSNYNGSGSGKPNFCELDIIGKKEKLKVNVDFVPLQTITEELKTLPMASKMKGSKTSDFRKKIYRKNVVNDDPNEVLRLSNVLKGECEAYRPKRNRSKEFPNEKNHHQSNMVNETCQTTNKKHRSKSRRRTIDIEVSQNKTKTNDEPVAPKEMMRQFGDLSAAKAMYYAELPNVSAFVEEKVESTQADKKIDDKHKKKHKKQRKKSKGHSPKRERSPQKLADAENPEEVIINKVENEFPSLSSPGSLTTVPSRGFKKDSEFSFGSLKVPKSADVDFRPRTNSPNTPVSFLDDALRKYKTDTAVYKGRHRKKHRTSPKLSSEDDEAGKNLEDHQQETTHEMLETEVKVIYKMDEGKTHQSHKEKTKDKKKKHRSKKRPDSPADAKSGKEGKVHKRRSKSTLAGEKRPKNEEDHRAKDTTDKVISDKPNKQSEKEDSILNLYQTNKSLQSESCTMIVDEEYLKASEKRKRKSRKSRSPSPSKIVQTQKEDKKSPLVDDPVLIHEVKERKTKQRSKSRVAEDTFHRKRYKSKAPTPKEEVSEELAKKMSRKSTGDVSKEVESFDGHKSLEGVQNEPKSEEIQTSQKRSKHPPSDTTMENQRNEVETTKEDFPYKIEEATVMPVAKENRKRSKSHAPKKLKDPSEICRPPVASKSHVFDGPTLRASDDHVPPKKLPRSKKSKSHLHQTKHKPQVVSKDRFYEELKRISNMQQIETSGKRFKVISKTITSKTSDDSATHSTGQSCHNKRVTGSRRFKSLMCDEKEKQAILKLPICKKQVDDDGVCETDLLEREKSSKHLKHDYETSEMEDGLIRAEKSKRKKKIRRTTSRKEVGFSHMNITPLMDMYRRPSRSTFVRRTNLPERIIDRKVIEIPKLTRQFDSRDVSTHSEFISEDTDFSTLGVKESVRKLNSFTMIMDEKILEICTKTIEEDGKISEGFTVSGSEPAKRFKSHESRKDKLKLMEKISRLHYSYHSPVEIVDGVLNVEETPVAIGNIEVPQNLIEEQPPSKNFSSVEIATKDVETSTIQGHDNLIGKSPIFLKTKRKFAFASRCRRSKCILKKDSSGKVSPLAKMVQTSTDSRSNSDTIMVATKESATDPNEEESELMRSPQKSVQKTEIKNPSRINSAVKLMESSLQIIKEESQSTDSSSKASSKRTNQNEEHLQNKQCELGMKETQTDLHVDDMDKIKEVITFLYNTMDQKKTIIQESVATTTVNNVEVQKNQVQNKQPDSSTESSSYHEQFKNFVRNVTPRFCSVKKGAKNSAPARSESSAPTKIPMASSKKVSSSKLPTNKTVSAGGMVCDTLSTSEHSSSSIERNKHPKSNPKNSIRKRSSSADVLTSGYYEKYQNTRALIEQQRKKRAGSADSTMRKKKPALQAEFKSSTSVSDFSSVVLSYKEDQQAKKREEKCIQCVLVAEIHKELIDKNIGTITDEENNKISPVSSRKSLLERVKSSLSCDKSKENIGASNEDGVTSQKDEKISQKDCQDKSLQTSAKLEENHKCKINVLYADIPCKVPTKRQTLNDLFQRVSSHSFISPRKSPIRITDKPKSLVKNEKVNRFDSLRRVFSRKDDHVLKSNILNYNLSEKRKKSHSKRGPENDYINLIKLERHLEQVLGLYPSIFKAIRSQIDDNTVRKLDKRLKAESPELFTSNDTLATTIETVTEYKNTDSFEGYPSFSESNLDRFNRYCEALNLPGQEYHLQQFINSQNGVRQCLRKPVNIRHVVEDKTGKNNAKKVNKRRGACPPSDSTSNSSRKHCEDNAKIRSQAKKVFKPKSKKRSKSKVEKAGSKISFFHSDSSSSSCADNWSVASPLYSITTPSLNFSVLGMSQSSTNIMRNKPTQTRLVKSRSTIEMSSVRKINRELALKHISDENKYLREKQNVLVVSVNSSCTVFATPSKFLAKVEKHLKKADDVKKDHQKKHPTPLENRKQVDEQSLHSLFFSDGNAVKSPVVGSEKSSSKKPFYIHGNSKKDPSEELTDSLSVQPPTSSVKPNDDEEDMGNFSADSLETDDSKRKNALEYSCKVVANKFDELQRAPPQNFFVYSNTVEYDRDMTSTKVKEGEDTIDRRIQTEQNTTAIKSVNNVEDSSKTLLSESGYESTKSKRTASIKNFFKKGGSLLDIFRNNNYKNKIPTKSGQPSNLTNFSEIYNKKSCDSNDVTEDDYNSRRDSPCRSDNTVYWTATVKTKNKTTFGEMAAPSEDRRDKSCSPKRSKGTSIASAKSCACSNTTTSYQRQVDECHAYAEKVLLGSQMRREGYYKQYEDFKEIPLELLIGKRIPNKYKYAQEVSVQTKPRVKPTSTQSKKHTRGKGVDATSPVAFKFNVGVKTDDPPPEIVAFHSDSLVRLKDNVPKDDTGEYQRNSDVEEEQVKVLVDNQEPPVKSDVEIAVYRAESRFRSRGTTPPPVRIYEPPLEASKPETVTPPSKKRNHSFGRLLGKGSRSWHEIFSKRNRNNNNVQQEVKSKDQATTAHISRKDKHEKDKHRSDKGLITFSRCRLKSRSPAKDVEGCTCDGKAVPAPKISPPIAPTPPAESTEESLEISVSSSLVMPRPIFSDSSSLVLKREDSTIDDDIHIEALVREIVEEAMLCSDNRVKETRPPTPISTQGSCSVSPALSPSLVSVLAKQPSVQLPPPTNIELGDERPHIPPPQTESQEEPEICRRSSEDFRKGLTDKEVFDKLLNSFEKEDEIATRLSKDEEFFHDQIKKIKKDSDESITEEAAHTTDPNEVIYSEDPTGGKHRSTHFWEEKMKAMKANEENPVREDDIGTCFSRGFRPDNIALSGDACFSLNKQDRIKFSKGMLTSEESIIDFSERETPLDFLLALGFMVDEASNALKDEDIRSRLLAAITEARVWINKITTTQGTLLYLVAYKSRPKTMRYFLQLVEAIINKRINNAIKLDGFLRVLEKVEEGEIQMINILGADKFEDEENEEKIVKKQLRQLFITVYKIAEKEAMLKGKQLSQQAIVLLRILAAKYRAGLHPHLELIARYIGQELLNTETQLEAAMIFLSRLDTAEVKLKEFEAYCDIKCERKKKKTTSKGEMSALDRSLSMPDTHLSEVPATDHQIPELRFPEHKNDNKSEPSGHRGKHHNTEGNNISRKKSTKSTKSK